MDAFDAIDSMDVDGRDLQLVVLEAPAKYAKQPATLSLHRLPSTTMSSSSSLQVTITPTSSSTNSDPVLIPFADIANLQQVPNKPTLKFILLSRPSFSPIVHLTHPTEALAHTQTITEAVASYLALRISKSGKPSSTYNAASASGSASASRSSSRSATPGPAGGPSPSSSANTTPASASASASAASLVQQLTNLSLRDELELRAELLKKHRTLAKLHQDLVRSRHVTENEFWAARKPLLERAALEKSQKPGHKSTRPPDVGRQTGDNKVTFTVTPQLVHSIFLQYPSVHRLFMQKVPVEMSEKDFWQRYVQSSLFKQSPATVAELATSGEQKAGSRAGPPSSSSSGGAEGGDAMFDACFSEEVQRLREEMAADIVRPTLNLTATEEDRVEMNGNMPDKMMRFTEEASILKKFNQHSSRILHSVIKHKRENPPSIASLVTSEVQMDDLAPEPEAAPIPLDLDSLAANRSGRARPTSRADADDPMAIDPAPHIDPTAFLAVFHSTSLRLGSTISDLSCQRAANDLESSLVAQRTVGSQATSLDALAVPHAMARELDALNATATELLRHYWGASRTDPEKQKRVRGAVQVHVDKVERWVAERGHVSKVMRGLVEGVVGQMRFALEGRRQV